VIVMPAVDLRGGRVVRLRQGLAEQATLYDVDPADAARRFEAAGAARLHVVDLDAALEGRAQTETIAALIAAVRLPIEVGGGVRTQAQARRYLEVGAERVIFGTAAVSAPDEVQAAAANWPGAVAVAIDARDGQVTVAGWLQDAGVTAVQLAARVRAWGVGRVQYTDVARDGTLAGPNLPAIEHLARGSSLRLTAAGGVASLDDLRRLCALEALGVDEVIVGKALYEGRFTLDEAHAAVQAHA
jgi:phosphoribosylformimino-5-aminoimidazole carboxamide ribotide isomerase